MTNNDMRFILWDPRDSHDFLPRRDDDGVIISDGVLGRISADNVYLTAYAEYYDTRRPVDLAVGECIKNVRWSLSGARGCYPVYRVR